MEAAALVWLVLGGDTARWAASKSTMHQNSVDELPAFCEEGWREIVEAWEAKENIHSKLVSRSLSVSGPMDNIIAA